MVRQLPDPSSTAPIQPFQQPTQVQRPVEPPRNGVDRHFEHDPSHRNMHPKETHSLRIALGSILAPKRPYTPSSRSSSGTASPAHPASYHSTSAHPPPHTVPMSDVNKSDNYLHPSRALYHPHTPSRLGMSAQDPNDYHSHPHSPSGSSRSTSAMVSPVISPVPSQGSPDQEHLPPLKLSDGAHDPSVLPSMQRPQVLSTQSEPVVQTHGTSGSGSGTPRAKFIETLSTNRAWDALIHGSFS